jgi:hypothetical protein
VELILAKLPMEALQNQATSKLQQILKTKKTRSKKMSKRDKEMLGQADNEKQPSGINLIHHYNESIINALKAISRQGYQAGGQARGANLSAKKLIALRNQGMIKNQQLI